MYSQITAITEFLPEKILSNTDLSESFPEWSVEKIASKTGIVQRHIAGEDEFTSDLATSAGKKLIEEYKIDPETIEFVLLCTQSPDYFLPSTACLVQDRLGLPTSVGALDINLGCSGYIYSLGLAKGLIETGQVKNVLLITADTYSKFLNPQDKSVRTIFGDGASATLIEAEPSLQAISPPAFGTDGSGGNHLIVPRGGLRSGEVTAPKAVPAQRGLDQTKFDLYMDGPEIFNFTLNVVPNSLEKTLEKAGLGFEEVDLFVFHQANQFMLDHLRNRLGIPPEKFFVSMRNSGNTVSSTIPIALSDANKKGVLTSGMKILLLGFGVGLSWAGTVITWQ
jgi:3-oxoacyl-[acyl-carrier-protein] synthase III